MCHSYPWTAVLYTYIQYFPFYLAFCHRPYINNNSTHFYPSGVLECVGVDLPSVCVHDRRVVYLPDGGERDQDAGGLLQPQLLHQPTVPCPSR